jgi:hypothetical protein
LRFGAEASCEGVATLATPRGARVSDRDRFSGEIRVEHYRNAELVDQFATEDAIWELMYFGHAR